MKGFYKILRILIIAFLLIGSVNYVSAASYDQTFPSIKLRYGKAYYFGDIYHNNSTNEYYLRETKAKIIEPGDYNKWANPWFQSTAAIDAMKGYVPAKTSVKILQSNPDFYYVQAVPVQRKKDNLSVIYNVWQYEKVWSNWIDRGWHSEYQPYEITWCGDGVRDNYMDDIHGEKVYETCDPNDVNKVGFGSGGCSNTCQPITKPTPSTCNNITVKPNTGYAPLNTNINCSGTNASNYTIKVTQNGNTVKTFNSQSASYSFGNSGNYQVQCFVNNTITSNACKEDVVVKPTPPAPSCDSLSVSPNSGTPGVTTSFNCSGTSASTYKVVLKKDGNTVNTFNSKSWSSQLTSEWNYEFQCFVNNKLTSQSCKQSVVVKKPPVDKKYDLALRKTIVNPKAKYNIGDEITFKITVFNQGEIRANNIQVTDYIPTWFNLKGTVWTKSGSKAILDYGNIAVWTNRSETISFIINSSAPATIKNFAEISYDDGNDCDSTPDSINGNQTGEKENDGLIDDDIWNGCNAGGDEDDHDIAVIKINQDKPNVYLVKSLKASQSADVKVWERVNYVIKIFNDSSVEAKNYKVEDHFTIASNWALAIVPSSDWIVTNGIAEYKNLINIPAKGSVSLNISFTITDKANGKVRNLAVVCEGTNTDCNPTPPPVCDDDKEVGTPEWCVEVEVQPDVYLIKSLKAGQSADVKVWDRVNYVIKVFNTSNVVAKNFKVEDQFFDASNGGLKLVPSTDWILSSDGKIAEYKSLINIPAKGSVSLNISFTITDKANGKVRNLAVVCEGTNIDCNPTPPPVCDDDKEVGTPEWCVEVEVNLSCDTFTATPNSGRNSLTTTLNCSGTNVSTYKIVVKDRNWSVVNTINNASGNVTLNTVWNYTASCLINGQTTTVPKCEQSLSVTNGWGGGWQNPSCNQITKSGNEVTCFWNYSTEKFVLQCGTNEDGSLKYLAAKTAIATWESSGRTKATFTCADDATPVCYGGRSRSSSTSTSISSDFVTTNQCTIQENPICGDGVVQVDRGEQCDYGRSGTVGDPYGNWGSCRKPGTANQCTIPGGGGGGGSNGGGTTTPTWDPVCGNPNGCVMTTPNGGELIFGPKWDIIVGHTQNPMFSKWEIPYLKNNSDYDLSFDQLCSKKLSGTSLTDGEFCASLENKIIYAYETIYLVKKGNGYVVQGRYPNPPSSENAALYPVFTANKAGIPAGSSYGANVISTTVKKGPIDYYSAYFAGKLNVRVAKPAVTTIGWGTSYVKDTTTADIKKVTEWVSGYDDNKNFVGTSVSDSWISSYADDVTNVGAVWNSKDDNKNVTTTKDTIKTTTTNTTFKTYNGLENVYIVKANGNYTLSSQDYSKIAGLTEATTYIVEGGNLTINKDIKDVNENIAFVVKGWNIIINADVNHIDGTYIAIPVNGKGWNIISSKDTNKQLVVNGSLYGDISQLVESRYYVSSKDSKLLSVGTIVSFGSRIFHKPAPLVSQFIWEYLNTTKVAK